MNIVLPNMATPSVGLNQGPNWGGSSMAPPTVVPLLPGQAFQAYGRGAQSLVVDPSQGPRLSGVRGTLDLLIQTGAAGSVRTVCFLTDSLEAPTKFLAVRVDASNRPLVAFTNAAGVAVGAVTPSYTAIPANQNVTVRFTWDSTGPVGGDSSRRASLRVNREPVPPANWSTNPIQNWASFQPLYLMLGGSLGDADFNGAVLAFQASNVVTV